MRAYAPLFLCVAAATAAAQTGSDVWVAPLKVAAGHVVLGAPRNVTTRPGYDNQPAWSLDGDLLYFSSNRGDGQSDIWSVVPATGQQARVTTTAPESEYSPAVVANGTAMTVVRVERDSTQRMWRLPLTTGVPKVLFKDLKPVGYYAWVDDFMAAMFVLGDTKLGLPNSLVLGDVRTGAPKYLAHGIGRGLARVPGENAFTYVQKDSAGEWSIMKYELARQRTTKVAPTLPGVEDYAWTPSGRLLAAKGSEIYEWSASDWHPIINLLDQGVTGITRMAVSPKGDAIAFVAAEQSR